MGQTGETSDDAILDLLRRNGPLGISELVRGTGVTPTAVRQRLARLMREQLVERTAVQALRGRPSHRYSLTAKGERHSGTNFADLALVLWQEVRAIPDPEVRRGLFGRVAKQMAAVYAGRVEGETVGERMHAVAGLFAERNVPFVVDVGTAEVGTGQGLSAGECSVSGEPRKGATQGLPVLTALACPYPQLAEQDRGICAVERMMLAELLQRNVTLAECRLDGDTCCRFQTN